MKRNQWILALFLCVFGAFVLQSCSDDDDDDVIEELIAANSTFADFGSWTLLATEMGLAPEGSSLGGAHGGSVEASVRKIYSKGAEARAASGYPVGTVIVKHTTFTDGSADDAYHGMVKRGNDFDTARGDWEYFILNAAGEIQSDADGALRGDSGFKACGGCHAVASGTDYIFTN